MEINYSSITSTISKSFKRKNTGKLEYYIKMALLESALFKIPFVVFILKRTIRLMWV